MYSCDLLKSTKKIEFSIIVLHIDTIIQHADILFLDVEKIHLACKGQNNVTIINAFIVISQFLALYILENLKNLISVYSSFAPFYVILIALFRIYTMSMNLFRKC